MISRRYRYARQSESGGAVSILTYEWYVMVCQTSYHEAKIPEP